MEFMDKLHIRVPNTVEMELIKSWFPEREELSFSNIVDDAILLRNGEIVGYGGLKVWSEAMMALNPEISQLTKARIYKQLMLMAVRSCQYRNLGRLHASPNSNEFKEILKKFGFTEALQPILALEVI
jgi:N-acetylglutamate synthase-like GNAT family acetyltransferase